VAAGSASAIGEARECGVMTERHAERPYLERQARPQNGYFERLVTSTEQATKSVAPMVTGAARANMELASLAGRRAQAYLDIPNAFARCRGPQDLFAAQAQFWQTAFEDYSACSRRIVAAMSAHNSVAPTAENADAKQRERDTLTFPDVFSFSPWAMPDRAPRQRDEEDRAA
jgi:hypothetical protein